MDRKGKPFKGRSCAEKVNQEYRFMQADMYNLFPAVGAVNAMRSNYNYAMLPDMESTFGSCPMLMVRYSSVPLATIRPPAGSWCMICPAT